MRPRHWDMIMKVTKKEFTPPHKDENMLLEQIIDLHLHEFTADVDEICDQSQKEDKMVNTHTHDFYMFRFLSLCVLNDCICLTYFCRAVYASSKNNNT